MSTTPVRTAFPSSNGFITLEPQTYPDYEETAFGLLTGPARIAVLWSLGFGGRSDAQNLAPGMTVTVVPDGDGGDPAVAGAVRYVDRETVAIIRDDPLVGTVCTHFPRVGYRVAVVSG